MHRSCQGRVATSKDVLQLSETCPHSWKSLPVWYDHADHQPGAYTCLVLNNHYWISGGSTLDSDKDHISGINNRVLTLETLLSFISFTFILFALCNLYHLLLTLTTLSLTLASEPIWQVPHRCQHLFLSCSTVSQHIFTRKCTEYHPLLKRFLGFYSSLEHMTHLLVIERNLTPTNKNLLSLLF